jgi:hypothetical protein
VNAASKSARRLAIVAVAFLVGVWVARSAGPHAATQATEDFVHGPAAFATGWLVASFAYAHFRLVDRVEAGILDRDAVALQYPMYLAFATLRGTWAMPLWIGRECFAIARGIAARLAGRAPRRA